MMVAGSFEALMLIYQTARRHILIFKAMITRTDTL